MGVKQIHIQSISNTRTNIQTIEYTHQHAYNTYIIKIPHQHTYDRAMRRGSISFGVGCEACAVVVLGAGPQLRPAKCRGCSAAAAAAVPFPVSPGLIFWSVISRTDRRPGCLPPPPPLGCARSRECRARNDPGDSERAAFSAFDH